MTASSEHALRAAARDLDLTGGTLVGSGLEFEVWRMRHPQWGEVALRVPAQAIDSNANDPYVETAELLHHEALVYRHLGLLGIPVPQVFAVRHYDVHVMVCEYVPADGTSFRSEELGEVLARLHGLPPPTGITPARDAPAFRESIAERVARRWSVLRHSDRTLPAGPAPDDLRLVIPEDDIGSLLHLDVRAANTIVRDGRVRALVDWSNSMVGDPALELARVAENARIPDNGIDYEALLRGYTSVRPLPERTEKCWTLYRLDAAIMLAVVFTSEAPDPAWGPRMLQRVHDLAERWQPTTEKE
ncbi:phosphotransferase family protein [Streptomyces sioyaensis]|uniref:phosphotransferase family protein n=1 Tax=Streptomyces sioyaensis TaxID=67364 RepID=UPI0037A3753B